MDILFQVEQIKSGAKEEKLRIERETARLKRRAKEHVQAYVNGVVAKRARLETLEADLKDHKNSAHPVDVLQQLTARKQKISAATAEADDTIRARIQFPDNSITPRGTVYVHI